MCFLKKHSHQNHKWTVSGEVRCCWTNEDPFGEEHSEPLPKHTCHKKPNSNGSLIKTNVLCNPQGGNDYKRGVAPRALSGFTEKDSVSGNGRISPCLGTGGRGQAKKDLSWGTRRGAWFFCKLQWSGKRHSWRPCSVSPTHSGDVFFP